MNKNLQPFKEDETLVVGKMYNVRCAIISEVGIKNSVAVPIIGVEHIDNGFTESDVPLHYHIDGRFTKGGTGRFLDTDSNGLTNAIIYTKQSVGYAVLEIKVLRRKCRRLTTGIKPPPKYKKYYEWYATFVGKSCKGKRCPHRGTTMLECNGKLVCPLHMLTGDKETEKIILAD